MPIAVVGAGVSGLSCGILLLERGHAVHLFAERCTPHTTSDRAGAVFSPFRAADDQRLRGWVRDSYACFRELAASEPDASGVSMTRLREYLLAPVAEDPWWAGLVEAYRRLEAVPVAYAAGVEARMPRMDMLRYMPYLMSRFESLGGRVHREHVPGLETLHARGYAVIVHCSGLGARELVPDSAVEPLRGQVLHVPNDIGLDDCLVEEARGATVTYLFAFSDHIVLGGTYERGQTEERTDENTLAAIVERCRRLLRDTGHPGWENLGRQRLRALAGLRPARIIGDRFEAVRLELESLGPGRHVIHNYGHGRTGVTLSWGCAAEVVRLVEGL